MQYFLNFQKKTKTMRKIKNIKQLRKEKKLLQQREKEILEEINSSWRHLKENFHVKNLINGEKSYCKNQNSRTENEKSLLTSALSYGAVLLARKLVKRTELNLEKFFS